jgi:alcohol dehydrogenase (NADP+)
MEKLLPTNKARHIGICNFSPRQLYSLIKNSTVRPAVHQMELHPYLQQTWWIKQHQAHGIALTAYSPLGDTNPTYHKDQDFGLNDEHPRDAPRLLENPVLKSIAETRNCTVAQVALSWGLDRGVAVIPKSSHVQRIKENLASPQCELSLIDKVQIKAVGVKYLQRFNNPGKGWGVELFDGLDGGGNVV